MPAVSRPLILDGAMGTQLMERGLKLPLPLWSADLNIAQTPDALILPIVYSPRHSVHYSRNIATTPCMTLCGASRVEHAAAALALSELTCGSSLNDGQDGGEPRRLALGGGPGAQPLPRRGALGHRLLHRLELGEDLGELGPLRGRLGPAARHQPQQLDGRVGGHWQAHPLERHLARDEHLARAG